MASLLNRDEWDSQADTESVNSMCVDDLDAPSNCHNPGTRKRKANAFDRTEISASKAIELDMMAEDCLNVVSDVQTRNKSYKEVTRATCDAYDCFKVIKSVERITRRLEHLVVEANNFPSGLDLPFSLPISKFDELLKVEEYIQTPGNYQTLVSFF